MKKLIAVIAILALSLTGAAFAAKKAKQTSGVVYAGPTHAEGKDLYVSGDFKDKLLGRGAIVYVTQASSTQQAGVYNVTAKSVTLYTTKGTLTGTGSGVQTIHADGTSDVSNGKASLTTGTGAYKGHSLKVTFSGPYKNGVYTFTYQGTYK
jgi:hypothetical protein